MGEASHQRAWWGIWLVAASITLHLVVGSLEIAVIEIHKVLGEGGLPDTQLAILGVTQLAATLALSIGLALHASGEPRGRRFAILAAACPVLATGARMVPWHLLASHEQVVAVHRWAGWAGLALWALAGLAFARAMVLAGGHSRTAVRLFAAVVVAHLTAAIVVNLTAPAAFGHPMPGSGARYLQAALYYAQSFGWLYLAADHLGAFPSSARTPRAAVRSDRARSTATAAAILLVLSGTGLLAVALWSTRRLGVNVSEVELASGFPLLIGGAAGLWRLRAGRVPVVALALGALVLVVASRFVLSSSEEPADDVALVPVEVPGLAISLPEGEIDQRYAYREAGKLRLRSRHLDLGSVELAWTGAEDPPAGLSAQLAAHGTVTRFSAQVGPVESEALIWTLDNLAELHASWRCPGDDRWFTLEMSLYEPRPAQLRALGERVLVSARCDPASLAAAPPIAIPYAPPPGYRPMPDLEPQTVAWQGPQGDVHALVWSSEGDLALALSLEPESVLAAYQVGHLADRIDWLESLEVGEDTRKVGQLVSDDGTRYLVTAWRCYDAGVSVAAFHVGESWLPREPALEVFRSGGCPPPTR